MKTPALFRVVSLHCALCDTLTKQTETQLCFPQPLSHPVHPYPPLDALNTNVSVSLTYVYVERKVGKGRFVLSLIHI